MGLHEGRTILVTGVTMHTSIAFKAAQISQNEGARVIVSNLPRAVGVTRRAVRRLDPVPEVLDLDVTDTDQLAALPQQLRDLGVEKLDGVVHAIAFANPKTALGGKFLETEWD
ncbi:MAG: SDR family oxidoreductase, partial [Cutibacterium granulosum]|nr:SDR family oxidoreductase [Cutibacterium granulosum]